MFTSNSISSILTSKTEAATIFKGANTPYLAPYKNPYKSSFNKRKTFRHKDSKISASGQSISLGNQLTETYKGFIDSIKKTLDQMFNVNEMPKLKEITFDQGKIKDAIIVFGSSGRVGRLLIKELMNCGRPVIVTTRRTEKLYELKSEIGKSNNLYFADNVDITDINTMPKELFKGVSQVVLCHGPSFRPFDNIREQSMDPENLFIDNMTPERVYDEGIRNVVELVSKYVEEDEEMTKEVISLIGDNNIRKWSLLNDVIMGGKSDSQIKANSDNTGAVFSGNLITEGGGFCSVLAKDLRLDLSKYDGISLKVKGNGQRFKFKLKTSDISDTSFEYDFQAVFDTLEEGFTNVKIPWHQFVQTVRSVTPPDAKKLDPSKITACGIILSRFGFNGQPNLKCRPGPFSMEIKSGISAFKLQKPSIILISAGALERNAILRDDDEGRKKEIPIVNLNPGNILNYLYKGENHVRTSGIPYTIIRPVGMVEKGPDDNTILVEVSQGDRFKGRTTRDNCAKMVASVLKTPYCCNKTFEIRDGLGVEYKDMDYSDDNIRRIMLSLHRDDERTMYGIRPFPPVYMVNNENKS